MTVSNEDILRKIEDLRQDMDALGRSVTSLRTDDVGRAFTEQIGTSYLENNRDGFRLALQGWEGKGPSPKALMELSDIFERALDRYEMNDLEGAMRALDKLRDLVSKLPEDGEGTELKGSLLGVLDKSRQQMAMMETLRFHIGRPMLRRSCDSAFGGLEPEEMEARLAPLSSATRLKIMALLYTSSRSFTEIGRELEMQKGHLQFHLKKLVENGYIKVDRRTHQYSIGEKGLLAIDGLSRLLSRL